MYYDELCNVSGKVELGVEREQNCVVLLCVATCEFLNFLVFGCFTVVKNDVLVAFCFEFSLQ